MSFNAPIDLQNELYKIAGFADAVDALGIHLKAVGTDLTKHPDRQRRLRGCGQGRRHPSGRRHGSHDHDPGRARPEHHLRVRPAWALNADLPGQTFADIGAIDAEITKVTTFLGSTLPSLLTPVKATQSSLQDQVAAINNQYGAARDQSRAYSLDNDAVLLEANKQVIAIVMHDAIQSAYSARADIEARGATAALGTASSSYSSTTLAALSYKQATERDAMETQWRQTWGDGVVGNADYLNSMNELIAVQRAETAQVQQQIAIIQAQGLAGLLATEATNAQAAGIDGLGASLRAFDAKAAESRLEFIKSYTDYYGQAATTSEDFHNQLLIMDQATAAQRLQVQQNYSDASTAALKTAQNSVTSLFGSIEDFAVKLQTGSLSTLSPGADGCRDEALHRPVLGVARMSDTTTASIEVLEVEMLPGRGRLVGMAQVEVTLNGVGIVLQGVHLLRRANGLCYVEPPCYRHTNGDMVPSVVMPQELEDAVARAVLEWASGRRFAISRAGTG